MHETYIIKKKICIWGTGSYAKKFVEELFSYRELLQCAFNYDIYNCIVYFIDNDATKHHNTFYGRDVVSADYFWEDSHEDCVLAFLHTKDVEELFASHSNKHYMRFDSYLEQLKSAILFHESIILDHFSINIKSDNVYDILKTYYDNNYNATNKLFIVVLSLLVHRCLHNENIEKIDMQKLLQILPLPHLIVCLSWIKGNNIESLVEYAKKMSVNTPHQKRETIGIIIERYYGGGIERVVSLLVEQYVTHGHKVVILVNEKNEEKDYSLPGGAVCHVMRCRTTDCQLARLCEIEECVEQYAIDIMCFHSGYLWFSMFYEMLLIRCMHRPVLIELHTSYPQLKKTFLHSPQRYGLMYSIANKTVVLSSQDKETWTQFGANCVYIPNPILPSAPKDSQRIAMAAKEKPVILWVGRLVQKPKNILDVIPIMRDVIKSCPDAILKIVGSKDRDYEYNILMEEIQRYQLKESIEICGYQKRIDKFYAEADVFLFTSSYESFSQVILESKQWGIPMVMYDIPWLELTRSQEGYIAVPQHDTAAAADAIIRLLDNTDYRKKMGQAAKNSVKPFEEYDIYDVWERVFREITDCSVPVRLGARILSDGKERS